MRFRCGESHCKAESVRIPPHQSGAIPPALLDALLLGSARRVVPRPSSLSLLQLLSGIPRMLRR
jgi:hypothetical protein